MKKLTYDQFKERTLEVSKARKIFIDSGLTNNITKAFELYQEIVASERMDVLTSSVTSGNKPQTVIDKFERPLCPKCSTGLQLGSINTGPGDNIGGGYKSQWYCVNCEYESYSKDTVSEVITKLSNGEILSLM